MIGYIKEKYNSLPKENRASIVVMLVIVLLLLIGIIVRWDFISDEVAVFVSRYRKIFTGEVQ